MTYSLLDTIYNDYVSNMMDDMTDDVTEAEHEFEKKYIVPVYEESKEKGDDMTELFNCALSSYGEKNFKNGFRACIRLIKECFEDD
ncbi:MAG: hypothetical protein HFE49_03655 [Clostridia bacterium]|nr:hypothetical protein [Clostridia bacterium]